jgi:hypothetical protein
MCCTQNDLKQLKAQVVELLAENPEVNGVYQKITLTLGGGEL